MENKYIINKHFIDVLDECSMLNNTMLVNNNLGHMTFKTIIPYISQLLPDTDELFHRLLFVHTLLMKMNPCYYCL